MVVAGTTLRYKPGIVTGGPGLVHDCGTSRAIGWFLEPLAVIALFGKKVWQPRTASGSAGLFRAERQRRREKSDFKPCHARQPWLVCIEAAQRAAKP